ncbi:MAG: diaminopimelate epimerase [Pontiella sp.]|nr:diaminopimelate epimerase [Pontiella sp.]
MKIPFTKMHGAGNDFMVVDDRERTFPSADKAFIQRIAARRTGIGCDGVLLIQPSASADMRMRFINPDGGEQAMCGNGARCVARLAFEIGYAPAEMMIETGAGLVHAEVLGKQVRLKLTAPKDLKLDMQIGLDWNVDFVDTGVPHAVVWVDDVSGVNVMRCGRAIRQHKRFAPAGTNANFAIVEPDGSLTMRTYERGVEAETLACGTGAAAVAVLAAEHGWIKLPVTVHCAGGHDLVIDTDQGEITLMGDAETVFDGEVDYGDRV